MKDVSIIFPIISFDKLAKKALINALNQTSNLDYELIIIIDNQSQLLKDKITKLLGEINFNNINIIILQNKKNLGLTKSLNIAISKCSGKYIMRNDQDDISDTNRLEEQYNLLSTSNKKISYSNFYIKNNFKKKRRDLSNIENKLNKIFEYKNPIAHSSIMIEKDFFSKIGYYNEKFQVSQDYDAWVKLSNIDPSTFIFTNKFLVTLNISDKNISSNFGYYQRYNSVIICLSKAFKNKNFIYSTDLNNFIKINEIDTNKAIRDKFNSLVFCYLYDCKTKINLKFSFNFFILVLKNYFYHKNLFLRRFLRF